MIAHDVATTDEKPTAYFVPSVANALPPFRFWFVSTANGVAVSPCSLPGMSFGVGVERSIAQGPSSCATAWSVCDWSVGTLSGLFGIVTLSKVAMKCLKRTSHPSANTPLLGRSGKLYPCCARASPDAVRKIWPGLSPLGLGGVNARSPPSGRQAPASSVGGGGDVLLLLLEHARKGALAPARMPATANVIRFIS